MTGIRIFSNFTRKMVKQIFAKNPKGSIPRDYIQTLKAFCNSAGLRIKFLPQ